MSTSTDPRSADAFLRGEFDIDTDITVSYQSYLDFHCGDTSWHDELRDECDAIESLGFSLPVTKREIHH